MSVPIAGGDPLVTLQYARPDAILAEHYLRCAGICALCIDVDGSNAFYDTVGIEAPAGEIVFCFLATDVGRIAGLVQACRGHQAAVAAKLEKAAASASRRTRWSSSAPLRRLPG